MGDRRLRKELLDGQLEAGQPSIENVAFVLLGAILALAVVLRLAMVI